MKTAAAISFTVASLAVAAASHAQLTGYYTILPNSGIGQTRHIDTTGGTDSGIVTGLVEATLGPTGMPVATAAALTRAVGSGPIADVNASNEILWWTPGRTGNRQVLAEQIRSDPSNLNFPSNFFPEGQGGDGNGFRAVHWTGSFTLTAGQTGTVDMSVQADDDAWVFVNGQLILDNGGVKGINLSTAVTGVAGLSVGINTIDIFFADRHETQSGIIFTSNVDIIPAPSAAALLGVAGLLTTRRRRTK